jgi:hypothetical protein
VPATGNVAFRWTVTAKDTINSRFRYGIIDSVNDGTNVYYNEYSKIFSNPSFTVATFTSNISSGNINLYASGDSASVQVTFQRLSLGSLTVEGYAKQKMAIGPKGDITGTTGVINTSNITPATSSVTGALIVSGGAGIAGNIYAGENIVATGNITALGQITATGNLTVQGNLIVQGDVTTLNAATLDVEDLNITVAKGAVSAAAANGAGLTVDGAGATFTYASGTDRWSMNKDLSVNTTYFTDLPRWSANSNPLRTGITFTSAATPPAAPFIGDQWYDTSDDTLYEWINDGATSYWVDIQTTAITAAAPSVLLTYAGGDIIPTSNLAYTLGNSAYRFGNVWTGNVTATSMTVGSINGNVSVTGNLAVGAGLNYYNSAGAGNGVDIVTTAANKVGYLNLVGGTGGSGLLTLGNIAGIQAVITTGTDNSLAFATKSPTTGANVASVALTLYSDQTARLSGNLTVGQSNGNILVTNGYANVTYTPSTTIGAAYQATGKDTQGGTGYFDFLRATNVTSGATNPNKTIRLTSSGTMEVINSAYSATLMSISDAGFMSVGAGYQVAGKQAVNGPAFRAYIGSGQTVTSGSQQKVTFDTENFDTNNNFANSRFTPTVEGYYQLNAEVRLDGVSGTGEMMIVIWKNGSGYKRGTNQSGTQIASNFWAMQVSSVVYANGTTDYFEIYVQQGSGGNVTVTAVNDPAITWFNGCMLRGA